VSVVGGDDERHHEHRRRANAAMPGFRFGPDVAHRDEMRRALESLRRSVDEDGSPESEYALALVSRHVTARARLVGTAASDNAPRHVLTHA
jgi:hypothetical protein